MLNFDFLGKSLGIVFPPNFVYDFLGKILTISIFQIFLLTDQISLSDCLYCLRFWDIPDILCITSVCLPGCDVINFEINLIFLIKSFFYMTKKSRQKFKYLDNKKSI